MVDEGTGVATAVRLAPEVRTRLEAAAKRLDRDLSWCIRRAVVEWLDRQEHYDDGA